MPIIHVSISDEIYDKIKSRAEEERRTMSNLVRIYLENQVGHRVLTSEGKVGINQTKGVIHETHENSL